jgi:hypothetical protein
LLQQPSVQHVSLQQSALQQSGQLAQQPPVCVADVGVATEVPIKANRIRLATSASANKDRDNMIKSP